MDQMKIKGREERDLPRTSRFMMYFGIVLGALTTITIWTGGRFSFKHVLLFSAASIPLCLFFVYAVEKLGSVLGEMAFGWSSRRATVRETLAADLEKARYSKRAGRFEEALSILEVVLDKDADFPDALYLKARILWEGFGNVGGAVESLERVMQLVPNEGALHRWASNYCDELIGMKKGHQPYITSEEE